MATSNLSEVLNHSVIVTPKASPRDSKPSGGKYFARGESPYGVFGLQRSFSGVGVSGATIADLPVVEVPFIAPSEYNGKEGRKPKVQGIQGEQQW